MIPEYLELSLRFEPADGAFRVRVHGPSGAYAEGSFVLPVSELEIEFLAAAATAARRLTLPASSRSPRR